MAAKFKITGVDELKRKLRTLDRKLQRSITAKALRAGAKITVRALRSAAPKDTGRGAKAIGTKLKTYKQSRVTVAISGERLNSRRGKEKQSKAKFGGPHFHLVEYGTGERFRTGLKAAQATNNQEAVRRAKSLRSIQSRINKLGAIGRPLGKLAAERLGTGRTGSVTAKPFFEKAWERSRAAALAAQAQVLGREIEAAARQAG